MSDTTPTSEDDRDRSFRRFEDTAAACVKSYLECSGKTWVWTTLVEGVAEQLGFALEYEGVVLATARLTDLLPYQLDLWDRFVRPPSEQLTGRIVSAVRASFLAPDRSDVVRERAQAAELRARTFALAIRDGSKFAERFTEFVSAERLPNCQLSSKKGVYGLWRTEWGTKPKQGQLPLYIGESGNVAKRVADVVGSWWGKPDCFVTMLNGEWADDKRERKLVEQFMIETIRPLANTVIRK